MKSSQMKLLISLAALSILTACNKPVYKYNPDFEGIWRTAVINDTILNKNVQSEIVIDGAEGSYRNTCEPCGTDLCNCVSYQSGKAVMNDSKTQMKIGSNGYPLIIQEEPTKNAQGVWQMKIGNLYYYRQ